MLTDKCRNQEALIAEFDSREQEYQELDAEIDFLKQQVESQRWISSNPYFYHLLQTEKCSSLNSVHVIFKWQRGKFKMGLVENLNLLVFLTTTV